LRIGDIDVFLLGAGRPARGIRPSALKHINMATCALDWQRSAFCEALDEPNIHFLGGYQVQSVIEQYPQLKFTVIADWAGQSILHTLLEAPFRDCPAIVSYSDTVFRPQVIRRLLEVNAEVVVCIDSLWRQRYEERTVGNVRSAETIDLADHSTQTNEVNPFSSTVEFTGLMLLGKSAVARLSRTDESSIGSNLIDAIDYFLGEGLSVEFVDAAGEWAEFDAPADIARFVLGTKADTLARLENVVTRSEVGRQVTFSVIEWLRARSQVLERIAVAFVGTTLIVRSSAKTEDNWEGSLAGSYDSILGVPSDDAEKICEAVDSVIDSYSRLGGDDQVLVQEQLNNVSISGVVFTRVLETGAPYYRINFDDETLSTESVTSGSAGSLRAVLVSRRSPRDISEMEPSLAGLMEAVLELEELLGYDKLDIEFAVDTLGKVHIFQVRPITVDHSEFETRDSNIFDSLETDRRRFIELQTCNPFTVGSRTVFGVMPDWNPAEIIGKRPSALAYSLYRFLITDHIWAAQRAEFGYRDIRPHNLIVAFSGQPYVDIRASLNSFIPASVTPDCAGRLVDSYIERLTNNTDLHDKLEFDIALTVLSPCFRTNAESRLPNDTEQGRKDIDALEDGLRTITNLALSRLEGDTAPIRELERRRALIESAELPHLQKAIALIEDCRQFGTLAFAHAARAGFVATTFLNDFVTIGIMTEDQRQEFLARIETVTTEFEKDLLRLNREEISMQDFIDQYGHLRPGTYDITVPSYREDADRYLLGSKHTEEDDDADSSGFALNSELSGQVDRVLGELGIESDAEALFAYMRTAIRAREKVKFDFTRNLSAALDHIVRYGEDNGISREALANLTYGDLRNVQNGAVGRSDLDQRIEHGRRAARVSQMIELPELIVDIEDLYCFEQRRSQPNFVTAKVIEAPCLHLSGSASDDLNGKILFISQADPGYDWIFVHGIVGLITKYGGANSHMAIRSAELGIPAAIGVGDRLFERLSKSRRVRLDCNAHKIDVVA
jgi:choline kinase